MAIKELNDVKIEDLPLVLQAETLMKGYWSLIPDAAPNCQKLHSVGIKKATDLWAVCSEPDRLEEIIKKAGISREYLQQLGGILTFNRFKPFALKKIENINPQYLKSLELIGIKETGALLLAGQTKAMNWRIKRTFPRLIWNIC